MNSFLTEIGGLKDRDIFCKFTLVEIWKDRGEGNPVFNDLFIFFFSMIDLKKIFSILNRYSPIVWKKYGFVYAHNRPLIKIVCPIIAFTHLGQFCIKQR